MSVANILTSDKQLTILDNISTNIITANVLNVSSITGGGGGGSGGSITITDLTHHNPSITFVNGIDTNSVLSYPIGGNITSSVPINIKKNVNPFISLMDLSGNSVIARLTGDNPTILMSDLSPITITDNYPRITFSNLSFVGSASLSYDDILLEQSFVFNDTLTVPKINVLNNISMYQLDDQTANITNPHDGSGVYLNRDLLVNNSISIQSSGGGIGTNSSRFRYDGNNTFLDGSGGLVINSFDGNVPVYLGFNQVGLALVSLTYQYGVLRLNDARFNTFELQLLDSYNNTGNYAPIVFDNTNIITANGIQLGNIDINNPNCVVDVQTAVSFSVLATIMDNVFSNLSYTGLNDGSETFSFNVNPYFGDYYKVTFTVLFPTDATSVAVAFYVSFKNVTRSTEQFGQQINEFSPYCFPTTFFSGSISSTISWTDIYYLPFGMGDTYYPQFYAKASGIGSFSTSAGKINFIYQPTFAQ